MWRWSDVTAWFRAYLAEEPAGDGTDDRLTIESVNARLEWLRYQHGLADTDRQHLDDLLTSDPAN